MLRVWTRSILSQLVLKDFMALGDLRGCVSILETGQLHFAQTSYRTQLSKILILPRFMLIQIAGLYHSIFLTGSNCTFCHVIDASFYRLPKASLEEKVMYLSNWVDSHLNDSEYILRKPVLFSEVGYLQHPEVNSTVNGDTVLKLVYDKIYNSAKKLQAGGGALIWQLMVEGSQMYNDGFSMVARDRPSTYKLIKEQSCRLQRLYGKRG